MKTVNLYDFHSKKITTIPAAELAPGFVRAKVDGVDGERCPRCGAPLLAEHPFTATVEPFAISKRDTFRLVGMPKLVQRWHHYRWIAVVRQGGRGRETIFDFQSVRRAFERFKRGEEPPRLPSEEKSARSHDGDEHEK